MRSSLRHSAIVLALLGSVGVAAAVDDGGLGKINRGPGEAQRPSVGAPPGSMEQSGSGDAVTNKDDPRPGAMGASAPTPDTNTGTAPNGPIGATPQTMPSKYSPENDAADKRPIMAHPVPLSDAEKRQIYDSVAGNAEAVARSIDVSLASPLPSDVTLYELPKSLTEAMPAVRGFKYVKLENKVLLVDPPNRIVVGEIEK